MRCHARTAGTRLADCGDNGDQDERGADTPADAHRRRALENYMSGMLRG